MHSSGTATFALVNAGRILGVLVVFVTIPVLIRYLGGVGFASWGILLALSAVFSTLELGIPAAVVRLVGAANRDGNQAEIQRLEWGAYFALCCTYGLGAVGIVAASGAIAAALSVPDGVWVGAHGLISLVFLAVAARSFLQLRTWLLFPLRGARPLAVTSVLVPPVSNVASAIAAWQTGSVEIVLLCFWGTQILLLAGTHFGRASIATRARRNPGHDRRVVWRILTWGMHDQLDSLSRVINFQFDKFALAGMLGIWAVGPYEVANRCALALRSVPASGLEFMLVADSVAGASERGHWLRYLALTRMSAYGVIVFMMAPMAVSPVLLWAWTGQMGHMGTSAFVMLTVGATFSVLALPAVSLVHATGKSSISVTAALISICLNIPASIIAAGRWGLTGVALGTACAMCASATWTFVMVHRTLGRKLTASLRVLGGFWPHVVVCAAWAAVTYLALYPWLAGLDAASRYSASVRILPGVLAVMAYLGCLTTVLTVEIWRGTMTAEERAVLWRLIPIGWIRRTGEVRAAARADERSSEAST